MIAQSPLIVSMMDAWATQNRNSFCFRETDRTAVFGDYLEKSLMDSPSLKVKQNGGLEFSASRWFLNYLAGPLFRLTEPGSLLELNLTTFQKFYLK